MEQIGLLIVDDNEVELELMKSILGSKEYRIIVSDSGAQALDLIGEEEVGIVLLDMLMPEMDGAVVCQTIRKNFFDKPIQVVLVSAISEEQKLSRIISLGADDFVQKPFTALELRERVRAAAIRLEKQRDLIRQKNLLEEAVNKSHELPEVARENVNLKIAYEELSRSYAELKEINGQLETVARIDSLSGLLNRLSLENQIDAEIERSIRTGSPLTGILFDIDSFKKINDEYGHQCGDMVIRQIGGCVKKCLRRYDFGARYGGDEFFLILPDSQLENGRTIAKRVQGELDKSPVTFSNEEISIHTSMGVAQFRLGESKENWIIRADKAMYTAKQDGGSRFVSEIS